MSCAEVPTLSADAVEMRGMMGNQIESALEILRYIDALAFAITDSVASQGTANVASDGATVAHIDALSSCAKYLTEGVTRDLRGTLDRAWAT